MSRAEEYGITPELLTQITEDLRQWDKDYATDAKQERSVAKIATALEEIRHLLKGQGTDTFRQRRLDMLAEIQTVCAVLNSPLDASDWSEDVQRIMKRYVRPL